MRMWKMKAAILSNINLFKLINRMKKKIQVFEPAGYGNWIQSLLGDKEIADYVICIIDGNQLCNGLEHVEDKEEVLKRIEDYFSYIKSAVENHRKSIYLISDIDVVSSSIYSLKEIGYLRDIEQAWGAALEKLTMEFSNVFIFPLKDIITNIGRKVAYSDKMWYLASSRFSGEGERKIEEKIFQMLSCMAGNRKKCLLLDLDNTLWGGVVGELGIDGVVLSENKEGARYKDFQKKIKDIKRQGILLGIVSKNNEEEVRSMMENHPDMVLHWDDFAVKKINWNRKSQNIGDIQRELNIGLDSMVFLDDNPAEREEIKYFLPEIVVPDFPEDTSKLSAFMEEIYWQYFLTPQTTYEDKIKTELYQQRQEREKEKTQHISLESYLKSLDTKVMVQLVEKSSDLSRVEQLIQKTNQFNLTTKRYTEGEILDMLDERARFDFWIAEISDKFGDNGKSVLLIIEKKEEKIIIDSFIMSCRVMGRDIEKDILYAMERQYLQKGYKVLEAKYKKTSKNNPVADLYDKMGYLLLENGEKEKYYTWTLQAREDLGYAEVQWDS